MLPWDVRQILIVSYQSLRLIVAFFLRYRLCWRIPGPRSTSYQIWSGEGDERKTKQRRPQVASLASLVCETSLKSYMGSTTGRTRCFRDRAQSRSCIITSSRRIDSRRKNPNFCFLNFHLSSSRSTFGYLIIVLPRPRKACILLLSRLAVDGTHVLLLQGCAPPIREA
jgi:hypothetical protein